MRFLKTRVSAVILMSLLSLVGGSMGVQASLPAAAPTARICTSQWACAVHRLAAAQTDQAPTFRLPWQA